MNRFFALLICTIAVGCSTVTVEPHRHAATLVVNSIQTELFFGLSKPDGSLISVEDWNRFLDQNILPRFPEGLTVLDATGRYRDNQQRTIKEPSKLVILFYSSEQISTADSNILVIAREYCSQFDQESILRADSPTKATLLKKP